MEELLLAAELEGVVVLVEEVDGLLVDRATGQVLDPAEVVLVGVDPAA